MSNDDAHRIRHILDAAREACSFAQAKSRSDLDRDRMLALALTKCIEIVGEAAASLSAEGKAEFPNIPWRAIVAMRNRLIHAYFDVDLDRVWDTVRDDLPPLIAALERGSAASREEGRDSALPNDSPSSAPDSAPAGEPATDE